jgi:large subunit ribosomal protein L4
MLRGGGKSFGPHPRDFATALPKKMYDLAWRTALSWRYRRGELIICEDGLDIDYDLARYAKQIFAYNHWGKADGRSLIITEDYRKNIFEAVKGLGGEGRVQTAAEVDVKDLLELGRIIIEKKALDQILEEHQSDLVSKVGAAV